jgi:amino acid adenylation domain-containing protein
MNKQNIEDLYPLSPLQQGMLFHTLLSESGGAYTEQFTLYMEGPLLPEVYAGAWRAVTERHSILRTGFVWERMPKPLQVVFKTAELPVEHVDWRHVPEDQREARLDAFRAEDRERGFDLTRAPLLRLTLFRLGDRQWAALLSMHHILLDGWSFPIVYMDVMAYYQAAVTGLEPRLAKPRPFREYIAWLGRQDMAAAEAFWRRTLAGVGEQPALGIAPPAGAPVADTEDYGYGTLRLDAARTSALQSMARDNKLTINTLLQGAWALLLSRRGGGRDVVFGTTVSGRPSELDGVEGMVGLFINTLPARVRIEEDLPVVEWLRGVQEAQAEVRQFEYTPLAEVQGWSEVPRDRPLFESLLVFENFPVKGAGSDGPGSFARDDMPANAVYITDVHHPERTNYPVSLVVVPSGGITELRLTYDRRRFDEVSGARLLAELELVLDAFIRRPGLPVRDLPVLPDEELAALRAWGTAPDGDEGTTLHALIEAQAAATPDAVALVHEGREMTYGELDARANRLAHRLRALGIGPERLAAVCMERSPELIVALLGVLKAGGAYVPIDPAYPADRISWVLEDSAAAVVLTTVAAQPLLPRHGAATLVVDGADAAEIAAQPATSPGVAVAPGNLSYVIYTSGSTGRPKGVQIEHRTGVVIVRWMRGFFSDEERSAVLGSTSVSFDVSVAEIYGTLCWGGTLVLVENALSLASLQTPVRTVFMVPSAAAELLRAGGIPPHVTTFGLAGEALPNALAQGLHRLPGARRVLNLYGPTEDTTYTSWAEVPAGAERVFIGRPVDGTRLHVLDGRLRRVPVGAPGELYTAGQGVARGYRNRPGLTAERFVPDPHGPPGSRMYRIFDRARWHPAGELEYLERVDHQVKIRGFRIELGEIETVLGEHPGVLEALVTVREDVPGDPRLAAYVVAGGDAAADAASLRAHLRTRLPDYMVPRTVTLLEAFPRTPNGKLDRAALPAPEGVAAEVERGYVPPRDETEAALAAIWADVLKVERVGVHDSFFDLGGHSLLLVQVHSRIKERLERDLPMVSLFRYPTVRALAEHLSGDAEGRAAEVGQERAEARRAHRSRRRERRTAGEV